MGRSLEHQSPEFDERNLFLMLSLGLLSVGDKLEGLLRRHVPEPAFPQRSRQQDDREPLAYLLLGAIRLSDVIRRELRKASSRRAAEPRAADAREAALRMRGQPGLGLDAVPPAFTPGDLRR